MTEADEEAGAPRLVDDRATAARGARRRARLDEASKERARGQVMQMQGSVWEEKARGRKRGEKSTGQERRMGESDREGWQDRLGRWVGL